MRLELEAREKNQCNISQAVGYEKNNEKHICPNFNLNVWMRSVGTQQKGDGLRSEIWFRCQVWWHCMEKRTPRKGTAGASTIDLDWTLRGRAWKSLSAGWRCVILNLPLVLKFHAQFLISLSRCRDKARLTNICGYTKKGGWLFFIDLLWRNSSQNSKSFTKVYKINTLYELGLFFLWFCLF